MIDPAELGPIAKEAGADLCRPFQEAVPHDLLIFGSRTPEGWTTRSVRVAFFAPENQQTPATAVFFDTDQPLRRGWILGSLKDEAVQIRGLFSELGARSDPPYHDFSGRAKEDWVMRGCIEAGRPLAILWVYPTPGGRIYEQEIIENVTVVERLEGRYTPEDDSEVT